MKFEIHIDKDSELIFAELACYGSILKYMKPEAEQRGRKPRRDINIYCIGPIQGAGWGNITSFFKPIKVMLWIRKSLFI